MLQSLIWEFEEMLQMRGRPPYARVVVVCDWCGRPIEDFEDACYEWQVDEGDNPITGQLFFAHETCARTNDATAGGWPIWRGASLGEWRLP